MTIQAAPGMTAALRGSPRFARDDGLKVGVPGANSGGVPQRRRAIKRSTRNLPVVLCSAMALWGVATAEAAPRGRHLHPRSFLFDPYDDGFYGPVIPELPPPSGYPPIFNFPEENGTDVYEATPRPQAVPYPYPQGFSLDVPTATDDGGGPAPASGAAPLNTYYSVADTLARCWRPPPGFAGQRWNVITLRISFKRDGAINGLPRIPYADPGLTADARSGLNQSLTAALQRCTPLNLTPGLGSAIAGQIFALRFIEQGPEGAAHVGQPQDPDARDHERPGGDPPAP